MTIGKHLKTYFGKPVQEYKHGQPFDVHKTAARIGMDWEQYEKDVKWGDLLAEYLMVQDAKETTHLVVGAAGGFEGDMVSSMAVEDLVAKKASLPKLEALFLGDITYEENELSWIQPGDLTPVWEHFPNLKAFAVRGYPGKMGKISMPKLESFTIQCSGMSKEDLAAVLAADMPNLERLELWVGTDDYGAETNAADWTPLLAGGLFPKLKYLGLRDSYIADDMAIALVEAPLLDRLDILDLSLGTLGDKGAAALYMSDKVRKLKHLDLHHHYMSNFMMGRFGGIELPAPKPPKIEVKPTPQPQSKPQSQPQSKGGFFSRLFGAHNVEPTPPSAPEEEAAPVKEPAPYTPEIDYASIPLIAKGTFGPTVNMDEQQEEDEYDGERYRYVSVGE